ICLWRLWCLPRVRFAMMAWKGVLFLRFLTSTTTTVGRGKKSQIGLRHSFKPLPPRRRSQNLPSCSLPVEVPWSDAASHNNCLFCETLADRPGQVLHRKARLNSARDGWVIIDFDCPSCGWTASLTCLIDDQGVKPPSVTLALPEEVT